MMRALVVDDEPQIRRALQAGLEQNGYEILLAASGAEALDAAARHLPDVVILDLAMPGMDGFQVCGELRKWSAVPVLVLSVREGEEDKIAALDLGADDYLTKPFSLGELLARLRALLRRAGGTEASETAPVALGDLHLDFSRRSVSLRGEELHLTPIEYELLRALALARDRVLTHRQLLTRVWGVEYADDTHTLRVHIANLRNKIESDPARPRYIQTEPRIGYRFRSGD
jgi:two-component system, OmpR family, KDP operon response regulator KdpE